MAISMADYLAQVLVSDKAGKLFLENENIQKINKVSPATNQVDDLSKVLYEIGIKFIRCEANGKVFIVCEENEQGKTPLSEFFNVRGSADKIGVDNRILVDLKGKFKLLCEKTFGTQPRKPGTVQNLGTGKVENI